jgi:two-component system sensor histidine kinase RegB
MMAKEKPKSDELRSQDSIRLRWLIRIRWAALVSLAIIFLGANYALELGLYSGIILEILGLGFASNAFLMLLSRSAPEFPDLISGLTLVFDVLLLTGLLFVSGGYSNPFSMVFLAYVTLAAVVLDARWTWGIFAASLVCFLALFLLHTPIPPLDNHANHRAHLEHSGFSLHLHGMLLAFVFLGVIISAFVTRMNREISQQAQVIEGLKEEEQEQRRLVSLATLTAGVTHELATPIATLSLIGEDLARELNGDTRWGEDVELLQQQLARCSEILQRLRESNSELQGEAPRSFKLREIFDELGSRFADSAVLFSFEVGDVGEFSVYSLKHALLGSLHALIRNAVQACSGGGGVFCRASVEREQVKFTVRDTGMGMSEDVRARLGEPFFTTKAPGEGMGLGVYLAKLFTRQVGGALKISSEVGKGSEFELVIPASMKI